MNKISAIHQGFLQRNGAKSNLAKLGAITTIYYDCFGCTLIITAIVALMDFGVNGILKFIYSLFK